MIPVQYNLFGPAQTSGSVINGVSGAPMFVGQVLTCSTYLFEFDRNIARAYRAFIRVLWTSRNTANYCRLVTFDDGPLNIVEIARVQGNGSMTPANQGVFFTEQFNALCEARIRKNLGFQIGGDGINQWTLNQVRLELDYINQYQSEEPAG